MYLNTPPKASDYEWFWSPASYTECTGTTDADGDRWYESYLEFDGLGRLSQLGYPRGGRFDERFEVAYDYDDGGGGLSRVRDANGSEVFWERFTTDGFGNTTFEGFGSEQGSDDWDFTSQHDYEELTGRRWRTLTVAARANYSDQYQATTILRDERGWPTVREDSLHGQRRTYVHDAHGRLEAWIVEGPNGVEVANSQEYGDFHEVVAKSGVGSYEYERDSAGRPRQLEWAGSMRFRHDGNGNVIERGELEFHYAANDQARTIFRGDERIDLSYDHDDRRAGRITEGGQHQVRYVGLAQFVDIEREDERWSDVRYEVKAEGRTVAQVNYVSDTGDQSGTYERHTKHILADEMGTTEAVSGRDLDEAPSRLAYGPWGERLDPSDWSSGDGFDDEEITGPGFTGHPAREDFGLVHMPARMYDPVTSRFMAADPMVGRPYAAGGWDRYAYVVNRPTQLVDPTGMDGVRPKTQGEAEAEGPAVIREINVESDKPDTPMPERGGWGTKVDVLQALNVGPTAPEKGPRTTTKEQLEEVVELGEDLRGTQADVRVPVEVAMDGGRGEQGQEYQPGATGSGVGLGSEGNDASAYKEDPTEDPAYDFDGHVTARDGANGTPAERRRNGMIGLGLTVFMLSMVFTGPAVLTTLGIGGGAGASGGAIGGTGGFLFLASYPKSMQLPFGHSILGAGRSAIQVRWFHQTGNGNIFRGGYAVNITEKFARDLQFLRLPVSRELAVKVTEALVQARGPAGSYSLLTNNCTTICRQTLSSVGLPPPIWAVAPMLLRVWFRSLGAK